MSGWIWRPTSSRFLVLWLLSPLVVFRLPPPALGVDWEAGCLLSLFAWDRLFSVCFPPPNLLLPRNCSHTFHSLLLRLRSNTFLQDIPNSRKILRPLSEGLALNKGKRHIPIPEALKEEKKKTRKGKAGGPKSVNTTRRGKARESAAQRDGASDWR